MNFFRKQNTELESLKNEVATLTEELVKLESKFSALLEESQTLKEANYTLQEENSTLVEEVTEVETEIAEVVQEIVKTEDLASLKAVEILAQVGAEPVEIVESEIEELDTVSEFKKLKGKDLVEFYNKNKSEIQKALKNHK